MITTGKEKSNGWYRKRTHMLEEIVSQPEVWQRSLDTLDNCHVIDDICKAIPSAAEWLFVGCGTSYYLAQAAAVNFAAVTETPAHAVPASELLLFPKLVMGRPIIFVLISRSGHTSEILRAAEFLKALGNPLIAVTCADGEPLEKLATFTLHNLVANEKSTVMTRSFTSMLLTLQYLAARLRKDVAFQAALRRLPSVTKPVLEEAHPRLRAFVADHEFSDYVFLAQGPLFPIACEAALKVTESSLSYAQNFHTLEFRHGPKSIVGPETLIGFLLSESGYDFELDVLEEVKELGGTTFVVTKSAGSRARAAADFMVELSPSISQYASLAAYAIWGQLLGLYTGLKKGLNPDAPRHLSRVVILNGSH